MSAKIFRLKVGIFRIDGVSPPSPLTIRKPREGGKTFLRLLRVRICDSMTFKTLFEPFKAYGTWKLVKLPNIIALVFEVFEIEYNFEGSNPMEKV